jgi:hypothetical protein
MEDERQRDQRRGGERAGQPGGIQARHEQPHREIRSERGEHEGDVLASLARLEEHGKREEPEERGHRQIHHVEPQRGSAEIDEEQQAARGQPGREHARVGHQWADRRRRVDRDQPEREYGESPTTCGRVTAAAALTPATTSATANTGLTATTSPKAIRPAVTASGRTARACAAGGGGRAWTR